MTSGRFQSTLISTITVPPDRQRRELTAINELAESIRSVGLINPIVITSDGILVAGMRRLTACTQLGWTHIPAQYTSDLDPITLQIIELEENVKRVDLPWQDHAAAVQRYHKLMQQSTPVWSQTDTATALGISQPNISRFLMVAEELSKGTENVVSAQRFSVAHGIVERKLARKADEATANFRKVIDAPKEKSASGEIIQCADFNEWAPQYRGPRFNFIHCDFPYGVGAGSFDQSAFRSHGTYDDSRESYLRLLATFAKNLDNFCAPSAHLMFWFSMKNYQELLEFFATETDFKMQYIPLVWSKHLGIISDPARTFRNCLEFCLFGTRGDRKIVRTAANHYHGVSSNKDHMSEKYEPMLRHFFNALVDNTSTVFDPTCGSGAAIRAADFCGAARVLGLEINPEYAHNANSSFLKARALRNAK